MKEITLVEKYAKDDPSTLEDYAEELVQKVEVIVAAGGSQAALAAKEVTEEQEPELAKRKPVVFTTVQDPSPNGLNLVKYLSAPGGNLTGMAGQTSELDPIRLEMLKELLTLTSGSNVGVLLKRGRAREDAQYQSFEDKADDLDLNLIPKNTSTVNRISKAFEYFTKRKARGVVVAADSFFNNNRKEVIDAAKDNRVPTIYQWQEFVQAGGLISYGPSILEAYQKAGEYVNSILFDNKKPGQMPCSSPSQYYLVMNYNTAKDLGIKPPSQLLGIDVELVHEAAQPVKRRSRP